MYIKEETLDKQSELVQYNKINEREEGIELLRIILMFMILLMHCFLNMGMLKNSIYNGIATEIAWLIEAFSIIAVTSNIKNVLVYYLLCCIIFNCTIFKYNIKKYKQKTNRKIINNHNFNFLGVFCIEWIKI